MNEGNYGQPGNEGPEPARVDHGHRPYWKRAHHDWRFWAGVFFMLAALIIFVMSNNLSLIPRGQPQQPPSGAVKQ